MAAARKRKHLAAPTSLANAFNLRWNGAPITPQAAQKWLNGTAMPTPEKMTALATLLNVPLDWLRFGLPASRETGHKVTERALTEPTPLPNPKPDTLTHDELRLVARIRALPERRRELVRTLIAELVLEREMWG